MKTRLLIPWLPLLMFPLLQAAAYEISWSTIDGGGGFSAGGAFSIGGTIGQPDAGAMGGGSCSLIGGFWGLDAEPGIPLLDIRFAIPYVVLSWPWPSDGFVLEQTYGLSFPAWTSVAMPVVVAGGRNTVTLPIGGTRFFRLRHP
jgi:hypothetical protein